MSSSLELGSLEVSIGEGERAPLASISILSAMDGRVGGVGGLVGSSIGGFGDWWFE